MLHPVMRLGDLGEGEQALVRVEDRTVLIVKVFGQFYATSALCPHAGRSLAGGSLVEHSLTCPGHGARFDVRTGACETDPTLAPLDRFPVVLEGGKVCVDVSAAPKPDDGGLRF